MTGIAFYGIILNSLMAFSAVAAVGVSLWFGLRKKPAFAIRDLQVNTHTTRRTGTVRMEGPALEISHSLILKIENLRDTKMQVLEVDIDADHSKSKKNIHFMGMGLSESNIFIPEKSIQEIEYKLDSKSVTGTYSQAKDIIVTVRTSFGDKKISFPKEWCHQFYEAVEEPWPFPSKSPFEKRKAA